MTSLIAGMSGEWILGKGNMSNKITIFMRNGGIYVSETDEQNTPLTIGQRLTAGGFIVCTDSFWGKERQLIVNLADACAVVLENIVLSSASQ